MFRVSTIGNLDSACTHSECGVCLRRGLAAFQDQRPKHRIVQVVNVRCEASVVRIASSDL